MIEVYPGEADIILTKTKKTSLVILWYLPCILRIFWKLDQEIAQKDLGSWNFMNALKHLNDLNDLNDQCIMKWFISLGIGILLLRILQDDIREYRITRWNTLGLMLLGTARWLLLGQIPTAASMIPLLLVFTASIPLGFRGVGGGDLALILSGGILLGPQRSVMALFLACISALPEAITHSGWLGQQQKQRLNITTELRVNRNSGKSVNRHQRYFAWGPYLTLGIWVIYLASVF